MIAHSKMPVAAFLVVFPVLLAAMTIASVDAAPCPAPGQCYRFSTYYMPWPNDSQCKVEQFGWYSSTTVQASISATNTPVTVSNLIDAFTEARNTWCDVHPQVVVVNPVAGPKNEADSYLRLLSEDDYNLEHPLHPDAWAEANYWYIPANGEGFFRASIDVNGQYDWSVTGASDAFDLKSTLTHEFGHWLGMDDIETPSGCGPSGERITMWGDNFGLGNTEKRSLAQSDKTGLEVVMDFTNSSPGSMTASAVPGNGSVLFQWTDTNPAEGDPNYSVMRATDCRGPYALIATVPKAGATSEDFAYLDTPLTESRPYHYYVTDGNCASAGAVPTGRPAPGAPPAAPSGLTALWSGTGEVTLSWTAPSGTVAGYRVWRNVNWTNALQTCENLEPGQACPNDFSRGTTTTTGFVDNVDLATTASYQVSAYTLSNGNANYSEPATITITCGGAVVTVADASLTMCPAGDGDVLELDVDLRSVCDPALSTPGVSVCAVKRLESTLGIHLWSASATGAVERDTLWATYSPATRTATIQHARASGCGTLSFDLVVNGAVAVTGVSVEVRSPDQGSLARGTVDRFDSAAFSPAMLLGSGPCWDFDGLGGVGSGDHTLFSTHFLPRHHVPRALVHPNGGEILSPGATVPIGWRGAGGDSARVTLSLTRATAPYSVVIAEDLIDTGGQAWVVPTTIPAGSTWRMKLRHSAGYYRVDNTDTGIDESDNTFTVLPNAVSDLIADASTRSAVIAWSDPPQGAGVAQAHELRYHVNMPITNVNFAQGMLVPTDPPGPQGTTHCVTIDEELSPCRTYSFGMRTSSGNVWSLLSNVATASTLCSGNVLVSCDFGDLMVGGSGEGGGSARVAPPPMLQSATGLAPVGTTGEVSENSVMGGIPGGTEEDLFRLPVSDVELRANPLVRLHKTGSHSVELDAVGLGVVDHPIGTEALAGEGSVLVGSASRVESVVGADGRDLSAILRPIDGSGVTLQRGDALTVRLGGDSRNVALVVESRSRPGIVRSDSVGILVQRPDRSGDYVTIASIRPRRGLDRHAIGSEGSGVVRLVFLREYELRSLARLDIVETKTPEPLTLTEATHSRLGSVNGAIDQRGGSRAALLPGDSLAVRFDPREAVSGTNRSHFLTVCGSVLASSTELAGSAGSLLATAEVSTPAFGLDAARPNPSAGSTLLTYTLATSAPTELAIYDVGGRRVRTLVNADQGAGVHERLWDGRDEAGRAAPAGVYFYRLRAGDWRSERKLVVLQK